MLASGRARRAGGDGRLPPATFCSFLYLLCPAFALLFRLRIEPQKPRGDEAPASTQPPVYYLFRLPFYCGRSGGVDLQQIERMICTLRITYKSYPPLRTTLDLYSDQQTDKLIRTLCDKWQLPLLEVSKSVHDLVGQLETYKLKRLQYPEDHTETTF